MPLSCQLDLPELQGEPVEVAMEKCKLAVQEIKGPVIVEVCFASASQPGKMR